MSPEFLKAFAPLMDTPDPRSRIETAAPRPYQPYDPGPDQYSPPGGIMPRQKRGVGNVLADFFSGERIAKNMRDPGRAAWGDLLGNIARISRGEDPSSYQMDRVQQLLAQDRQQAEWDRITQGRNAFADLLIDPTAEEEARLAQYDPEALMGYRGQQADIAAAQAKMDREAEQDEFNRSKPISLGGNSYALPSEDGGWEINQIPVPPGFEIKADGEGQLFVIDKQTGAPVRAIGSPKPRAPKTQVVTVDGPNGPEIRVVDTSQPGTVGRAVPKAPAKGADKGADKGGANDVISILRDNNVTLTGPDPVAELIKGSTSGMLENVASMVPGFFGKTTPGQANIGVLETIDNSIILALAGGKLGAQISDGDRKFFERMSGKISDPNIPVGKRLAAWGQVRARLRNIAESETKRPAPKAPATTGRTRVGGDTPAMIEARRRGLIP